MKRLIYLLLFIPTLAFGGIEPDTSIFPMGLDGMIKLPYIDDGNHMIVEKERMNYLNYMITDLMKVDRISKNIREEYKYSQIYVDSIRMHYDNILDGDATIKKAYQSQISNLLRIEEHNRKMIEDLEVWGEKGWKRKKKAPIMTAVITGVVALLVGFIGGFIISKL